MLSKQEIDKLLEPTIEGLGFEYICSELANTAVGNKNKGGTVVRIFIDKSIDKSTELAESGIKSGVTLDDCQQVSRHVTRVLEVEGGQEADNKFRLEISSPGLDRPLVRLKHFAKFIGKKVKIKLNVPIKNHNNNTNSDVMQRNIVGYISAVVDNAVIIENIDSKDIRYNIEFDNINKANLVPEW